MVHIAARSQRRLPLNIPPRFIRPRPYLTPCTLSSRTPSQDPLSQGLQSSAPLHFQLMGYNSPVLDSRASTTPSCHQSPTSETNVGLQESERSDAHLLRRDAVSSRDSTARLEPESILRQPGLSRQPSARSRHGSTISLNPEAQERIPAPRNFRTGTECLHQEE